MVEMRLDVDEIPYLFDKDTKFNKQLNDTLCNTQIYVIYCSIRYNYLDTSWICTLCCATGQNYHWTKMTNHYIVTQYSASVASVLTG